GSPTRYRHPTSEHHRGPHRSRLGSPMGHRHDYRRRQKGPRMVITMKPRIELDWKISKVLKEYPELLDTLADSHPAFGKLRNPLLRRVQSKLVTVEQAAEVAGLEPESLLARLN